MKKNYLIWLALVFSVVYLYTSSPVKDEVAVNTINLATSAAEITQGNGVVLSVTNNTQSEWIFANECPGEPFNVYRYENGDWKQIFASAEQLTCEEEKTLKIAVGEQKNVDYTPWSLKLLFEKGRYQIRADFESADGNKREFISNDFNVVDPSFLTTLWREILYRPFYNLLLALTKFLPFHSLGMAIIILTILIRVVLIAPSQKAMKAQKAMQVIQPKLQHVKEKFKGDQQRIAQETMRIWRDHKVNPLGSCLPMLVQFPVLIALFYVVREGLDPNNVFMLYGPLQGFDISLIETNFLGILDLTKANVIVLPLIVGFLQFAQMKLAMGKKSGPEKSEKKSGEPDLAAVNNIMLYMMPVLIAVFTASLPAGVGLYWAVSTIFGIGQQLVVNKSPLEKKADNEGDVRVKIIN